MEGPFSPLSLPVSPFSLYFLSSVALSPDLVPPPFLSIEVPYRLDQESTYVTVSGAFDCGG
jgi:hypothetical protein